jgi:hypothetical protein
MFEYGELQDTEYPTPQVRLTVRSPTEPTRFCSVEAIVDTGASITCLPVASVGELGLQDYGYVIVQAALGEPEEASTAYVEIDLGAFTLNDREVLLYNRPYALIGRDILNRFRIVLDAPQALWSLDS